MASGTEMNSLSQPPPPNAAKVQCQRDQPLLDAIVQVAFDAAAGEVAAYYVVSEALANNPSDRLDDGPRASSARMSSQVVRSSPRQQVLQASSGNAT
jgi:hypothetical protein